MSLPRHLHGTSVRRLQDGVAERWLGLPPKITLRARPAYREWMTSGTVRPPAPAEKEVRNHPKVPAELMWLWRATTRPAWKRPVWWVQVILVGAFVQLYDVVRNLAPAREGEAFRHSGDVLRWEGDVGVDIEKSVNGWLAHHHSIAVPVDYYYDSAHYIVTFGVLIFVYVRREAAYRRLRDALLLTNLVGLLGFWLFPLAPPRLLPGFVDTVLSFHTPGAETISNNADVFAAMPSLHIGWAIWVAICGLTLTRRVWLRALAVFYPFFTIFVVISTGNHYVLDVVAGALCASVGFAVPALAARLRRGVLLEAGAEHAGRTAVPPVLELADQTGEAAPRQTAVVGEPAQPR